LAAKAALYSLAGVKEDFTGTVKTFTPLLLKTPMSKLASKALTRKEQELYQANKESTWRISWPVPEERRPSWTNCWLRERKALKPDSRSSTL